MQKKCLKIEQEDKRRKIMLPQTIKNKVYKKLMNNKLKGLYPSNVKELAKELGFTRNNFYVAFTDKFTYCPNVESKIREWATK